MTTLPLPAWAAAFARAAVSVRPAQAGSRSSRWLRFSQFAGLGAVTLAAMPLAHAAAPTSITSIAIERDCFGCATGARLVLNRDGTATYTVIGKARLGTQDKVMQGRVGQAAFADLARLAVAQGFFDMQDSYDDAQTQDGAWSTVRIERSGQVKSVFRREGSGPAALRVLEEGIEAARLRAGLGGEVR